MAHEICHATESHQSYGLYSYGLYRYGLYSCGLYRHGRVGLKPLVGERDEDRLYLYGNKGHSGELTDTLVNHWAKKAGKVIKVNTTMPTQMCMRILPPVP